MRKKYIKSFCLILLIILFLTPCVVKAQCSTKEECEAAATAAFEKAKSDQKVWGDASAYATHPTLGNGGKKCSEETTLCFSGSGLIARLIRYRNGTEEQVGRTVLMYTPTFLREEIVVDTEAQDTELDQDGITDSTSNCVRTYYFPYKYEEVTKYPENQISFSFAGGGNLKKIQRSVPSPASGQLPVFIQGIVGSEFDSLEHIAAFFDLDQKKFNFEQQQNIEQFYVIFEPVKRIKGARTGTYDETTTDLDSYTISSFQLYYNSCNLNKGMNINFEGASSSSECPGYKCKANGGLIGFNGDTCSSSTYDFTTTEAEATTKCKSSGEVFTDCNYKTAGNSFTSCVGTNYSYHFVDKTAGKVTDCETTDSFTCNKDNDGKEYTTGCTYNEKTKTYKRSYKKCGWYPNKEIPTTKTCTKTTVYDNWESSCLFPSYKVQKVLYTRTYAGKSTIVTGRSSRSQILINGLFTALVDKGDKEGTNSRTAHEVLDKNNIGTGVYEYYIGPTLKDAIVGHNGNNKYKLYVMEPGNETIPMSKLDEGYAVGMSIWWVPSMVQGCSTVCAAERLVGGDTLLKCAESFCDNAIGYDDRWNSQAVKKACILACGYKDSYRANNCANLSPDSEYMKALNKVKSGTYTPGECGHKGCFAYNDKGELAPPTSEKNPTSAWCYSDKEYMPEDQKTFTNIACFETEDVDNFTNTAHLILSPGEGVDYKVDLKGKKQCYVWFDLESWKLAYASYNSDETICLTGQGGEACASITASRILLEQALDKYNKAAEKGYSGPVGNSISAIVDPSEENSIIQWEQTNYSTKDANGGDRAQARVAVTEVVSDKALTDETYALPKDYEEVVTGIVEEKNVSSANKYSRLVNVGSVSSNSYQTSSTGVEEFGFEKYCVSTDGLGTVFKADKDGSCGSINVTGKTYEVEGSSTFYTTEKAVNSTDFFLEMNAKVTIKGSDLQVEYDPDVSAFSGYDEKCYDLDCNDKPGKISCNIIIKEQGNTVAKGGAYNGSDGVKATIDINGKLLESDDEVVSYAIVVNPSSVESLDEMTGKIESVDIKPINKGVETFDVYCVVKTRKGEKGVNDKKVILSNCNSSTCKITEVPGGTANNKKYAIEVFQPGGTVYMATSNDIEKFKLNKNSDGKYEYTLKRSNTERGITIYGIVDYGNEERCCYLDVDVPTEYNCEEWNKDQDKPYSEVYTYCATHLHEEVHHHTSTDDCVNSCISCPLIESCDEVDRQKVQTYCDGIYGPQDDKHENALNSQCMQRCFAKKLCPSDGVIFRPINNYNPFPNSYDSESPYDTGKRQVGSNWIGFTNYIKHDINDSSSVTGPSNQVEYVIDLTPEDIRNIRQDTENKKNKSKKDSYTENTLSMDLDKDYDGEYISSFIHDDNVPEGGFSSIFSDPSTYKK